MDVLPTKEKLNWVKANFMLTTVIALSMVVVYQYQTMFNHLQRDLEQKELSIKDREEVIKFWRDAQVQSERLDRLSRRLNDSSYEK